jgi:hypothetical protein
MPLFPYVETSGVNGDSIILLSQDGTDGLETDSLKQN